MKITPKAGADVRPLPNATPRSGSMSYDDAKARAIAKLSSGAPEAPKPSTPDLSALVSAPQVNQSSVSAEELSAVKPKESQVVSESQGQINNNEASTEAPKAETKAAEDPLSTQYANLARKEKALRAKALQQEQSLKAKEAAIAAKEAELRAKEQEYQSKYIPKDKLTNDTLNALAEAGLTYDQITELMLNQQNPQKMQEIQLNKKLEAKIQELEDKISKTQKSAEEQQTQAYKQAVNQIRNETKSLVEADPTFETIKATGSIDDVVQLIEETFKQEGVLLSVEDAAREVEEYLVEEAMKIAKLNKIQQRLAPAPKPAEPKQEPPKQQQTLKTLTNSISSPEKLSARDRAILAFKGELKS